MVIFANPEDDLPLKGKQINEFYMVYINYFILFDKVKKQKFMAPSFVKTTTG